MAHCYKLPELDEFLTKDFLNDFYDKYESSKVLNNWWKKYRKIIKRSRGRYAISNMREPYMYVMILFCRLYDEMDCSQFSKAWLPLAYHVAMWGKTFNWGGVISKQLSLKIAQEQSLKLGNPPEFHMVSFPLDVLCAQNTFLGLSLS
jgi:hypothetical protein